MWEAREGKGVREPAQGQPEPRVLWGQGKMGSELTSVLAQLKMCVNLFKGYTSLLPVLQPRRCSWGSWSWL